MIDVSAAPGDSLSGRLAAVREAISAAAERSGRNPAEVRLVAVTKGRPAADIVTIADLGVTDIGENRVQEAARKHTELGDRAMPVSWHLLGHLQTNKARLAAVTFDHVHSLDSDRVARALAAHRTRQEPLTCLVEVDLTDIAGRSGVEAGAAEALVLALTQIPELSVRGLMTIAPPSQNPEDARAAFRRLRELRDQIERAGHELPELSMGMSDDYTVAVEEGATMVRLGRALFGERP